MGVFCQSPSKTVLFVGNNDQTDGIGSVVYALQKYAPHSLQGDAPLFFTEDMNYLFPVEHAQKQYDFLFFTYPLVFPFPVNSCLYDTTIAKIKIACSVIEMDAIPRDWVTLLNEQFDAVVVPDPYLVAVYKNSGVVKPIFCIPQGILVKDYCTKDYAHHTYEEKGAPFTFGVSARNYPHKNLVKLMEAFHEEFGNDEQFRLCVHAKDDLHLNDGLAEYVADVNAKNIIVTSDVLSRSDYIAFINSLDCYVLISRGEGFSVTPREAMALGIPCILSNNTAHTTICKTGCVYAIECPIKQPCFWIPVLDTVGNDFDCYKDDVKKALRDVYLHYEYYYKRAQRPRSRLWAMSFEWEELVPLYETLFNPARVVLADRDYIEEKVMYTTSKALVEKYEALGIHKTSE